MRTEVREEQQPPRDRRHRVQDFGRRDPILPRELAQEAGLAAGATFFLLRETLGVAVKK